MLLSLTSSAITTGSSTRTAKRLSQAGLLQNQPAQVAYGVRVRQTFKLLMCIGLGQMEDIDENNVMIAGQSLASYFESNVLLHHRNGGGKLTDAHWIFGNLQIAGKGSWTDTPHGTPDGEDWYRPQMSFSRAYSSPNSNTFGVYKAIRNGTRWSPNWQASVRYSGHKREG